ncbi:MAG: tRNA dihydrouridine synthase DusB [Armatimonadetes bacterium]|nr:tRNA dihydrouridine synthase DusB [Armatimonadota bacterium]
MRIGELTLDPPLALAPMSGINDRSFRLLCREFGAGIVWTGLISANALQHGNAKTADLLRFLPEEHPVCAQIFGPEPAVMAEAAADVSRQGADLVDINMGCSVPKVLKGRAGVDLMADPDRAEAIVRACVTGTRVPITVKLRTGWVDKGESAVAMARRCEAAGASAVIIHPRWAREQFRGEADWSVIRAVKDAVGIPVIGNGDIHSGGDAVRMREETGCDGVMIGRAALGNPWIFREAATALQGQPVPEAPTAQARIDLARRHVELALRDRGEKVGTREMRKHVAWYLRGFPMARALREQTNHARTRAEMLSVLETAEKQALAAGDIR